MNRLNEQSGCCGKDKYSYPTGSILPLLQTFCNLKLKSNFDNIIHTFFFLQELKGKILLKAKKIGGLECSLDETLVDDVSDDDEMTNGDAESPTAEDLPAECLNPNEKV